MLPYSNSLGNPKRVAGIRLLVQLPRFNYLYNIIIILELNEVDTAKDGDELDHKFEAIPDKKRGGRINHQPPPHPSYLLGLRLYVLV